MKLSALQTGTDTPMATLGIVTLAATIDKINETNMEDKTQNEITSTIYINVPIVDAKGLNHGVHYCNMLTFGLTHVPLHSKTHSSSNVL